MNNTYWNNMARGSVVIRCFPRSVVGNILRFTSLAIAGPGLSLFRVEPDDGSQASHFHFKHTVLLSLLSLSRVSSSLDLCPLLSWLHSHCIWIPCTWYFYLIHTVGKGYQETHRSFSATLLVTSLSGCQYCPFVRQLTGAHHFSPNDIPLRKIFVGGLYWPRLHRVT